MGEEEGCNFGEIQSMRVWQKHRWIIRLYCSQTFNKKGLCRGHIQLPYMHSSASSLLKRGHA